MSKTENVVPMEETLRLTDGEMLTLENLQLKLQLIQQQAQALLREQNRQLEAIGTRLEVDIKQHNVNVQTGMVSKKAA